MPSNTEIFSKYPNNIFIETGSYLGDGIQQALDAGFSRVISIELSEKYLKICQERFADNPNVEIVLGDSFIVLPDILKAINEPVTFWLDGHNSGGDTGFGEFMVPLIQELNAIKEHSINTHTILIDDMRLWPDKDAVQDLFIGFNKEDIFNKLFELNKDYKLSYEDGYQEDDILVASV
jgi:hypothetical protein